MVIDSYDDSKNGAAISTRRFVELLRKEHEVFIISTGDPAPGKVIMPHFYAPVVRKDHETDERSPGGSFLP